MQPGFVIMQSGNPELDGVEEAEGVVADLTNERPNCYLEVGYVLGFEILFWQPGRLEGFRRELEKRILQRKEMLT